MKNPARGFTLIDLLITMSIIGVLFGLGVAKYNEFNRRQILDQAAQTLKSNLRLAQDKALAGEKPTIGCGVLDGYQANFVDSNPDYYTLGAKCSPSSPTANNFSLPTGVSFSSLPSPNPIIFKVLGHGTNINGSTNIVLSGFSSTRTITVTSTGEIR
jgi:prepilin-type N-terminal cleavage/methylation domain-containing protein